MNDDRGILKILSDGPIRQMLAERKFKDRKFYGILMKDGDEARYFRRTAAAAMLSSLVLAAYMGTILERVPPLPSDSHKILK